MRPSQETARAEALSDGGVLSDLGSWDVAFDLMMLVDPAGWVVRANRSALTRLGYSPTELLGEPVDRWVASEDAERVMQALESVSGGEQAIAARLKTRMGDTFPAELRLAPTKGPLVPTVLVVARESPNMLPVEALTSMQRDVALALASTSDLRVALESIVEHTMRLTGLDCGGFYLFDDDGALVLEAQVGLSEEFAADARFYAPDAPQSKLVRKGVPVYAAHCILRTINPNPRPAIESEGLRAIAVIPIMHGEKAFGCMNVASRTRDEISSGVKAALESIASLFGTAIARIEAERALAERGEYYRTLIENATDIISIIDAHGIVRYESPSLERVTGYKAEEIVGRSAFELMHPDDAAIWVGRYRELVQEADAIQVAEARYLRKDGTWAHLEGIAVNLLDDPRIRGVLINARDVTDRKRYSDALLCEREMVRGIIETSPAAILISKLDGTITDCSNAAWRDLECGSRQQLIGRSGYDFLSEREKLRVPAHMQALLAKGIVRNIPCTMRAAGGREYPADVSAAVFKDSSGNPVGIITMALDMTERLRTEQDLRQAQKLESIGRLAGGVAHDFNNLLTAIKGYASLAKQVMAPGCSAWGDIDGILTATDRAENLTRQLLAFSRRRAIQTVPLDIDVLLGEMTRMLARLLGDHVRLSFVPGSDGQLIQGDVTQLEQLIVNLAINGRDAMPDGGTVTVETAVVMERDQKMVRVSVTDTGTGIPPEDIEHVFEPFFTTKAQREGTGLGLATVYGIVRQHGASIQVRSEVGKGARFDVFFPLAATPRAPMTVLAGGEVMPRGVETVLVVEDEVAVLTVICRVLGMLGYRVLEAGDGTQAMEVIAEHGEQIQLLLTDVVMPHMGGKELAERVRAQRPELPVLFTSGYTKDMIGEGSNLLVKPFTPLDLAQIVRKALDRKLG